MTEAKIWRIKFGSNSISRDVKAPNIYAAISKARRLIIEEEKREEREWKWMLKEPCTEASLEMFTDD